MRYPKHPFSPDESAADARAESPDDRYDVTPDAAPDRGSGTPPPLPRRTGDSGFRPHEQPGPASQDSREAADPHGSRPLAPRPGAEPLDSWAHEDPQLAWVAVPPQDGTQDSSVPVDPQEAERAWPPSAPADEPQEPWAQGNYRPACPADAPAADEPQEPWAQGNYRPACPADAPAADERQEAWAQGNYRPACPADAPAADEPHEPWAQGNYRPACPADAPVADQPAERPVAGDRQQVWSDGMSPSGGAQDPWAYADPQDYRPPETPQEVEPREPWDYGDRGDSWPAEAAGQGSSGEPWDYADAGGDPRTQTPAQGQAQEPWADGDPEGSWDPAQSQPDWAPAPPAQADPDTSWTSPGAQQDWAPAPPVQVDPDTSWTSPGAQQDWPAPPRRRARRGNPGGRPNDRRWRRTSPGCRLRRRPDGGCVAGPGAWRPYTGANCRSPSPQRPSHGPIGWQPGAEGQPSPRPGPFRRRWVFRICGNLGSHRTTQLAPFRTGSCGLRPPIRNSYGTRNTRMICGKSRPTRRRLGPGTAGRGAGGSTREACGGRAGAAAYSWLWPPRWSSRPGFRSACWRPGRWRTTAT